MAKGAPVRFTTEADAWRGLGARLEQAEAEGLEPTGVWFVPFMQFGLCNSLNMAAWYGTSPDNPELSVWVAHHTPRHIIEAMRVRIGAHVGLVRIGAHVGLVWSPALEDAYLGAPSKDFGVRALFCYLMAAECDDERRRRP